MPDRRKTQKLGAISGYKTWEQKPGTSYQVAYSADIFLRQANPQYFLCEMPCCDIGLR